VTDDRYVESLAGRAGEVLPEPVARYVAQGARDGLTAAEAVAAWDRWRFLPQVLRDVTAVDPATTLLGADVSSPLGVAPTTMQRAAHPEGEVAMARAVAAAGSLLVLSSNAGSTFESVGETGVTWWLQMYVTADRSACLPLLERAVAAGARGVVLTADTPVVGTKYDGTGPTVWDLAEPGWLHANFPGTYGTRPGDEKATDLGPQDVDWLAKAASVPVVVKGVLQPADARRCVDAGAAAVWVSNHGGRQLDGAAATADCLLGVVDEVGGSVEVYVDGGVRSGRHGLAALALGARGVFLGWPPVWALAVDGQPGVERLLNDLREELVEAMTLAGAPGVGRVVRSLLADASSRGALRVANERQ